jgi:hypothetical protein
MPLPNQLVKIERSLWTNDAEVYERTLVEDGVRMFAETGVITRDTALAAIRQENSDGRRWASVEFDDVRRVSATADATMLTYRARARWEHETTQISMLASSLYVNRDGAWRLVVHQQTPSASRMT